MVIEQNGKWVAEAQVQFGDDVFVISKRYHVPATTFTQANGLTFQSGLEKGSEVFIPLGAFNHITSMPPNEKALPLSYTVQKFDNMFKISRYAGIPQKMLQEWNSMSDNAVLPGQKLFIGWLLYDDSQKGFAHKKEENVDSSFLKLKKKLDAAVYARDSIIQADTIAKKPSSPDEEEYQLQTNNGDNVVEERGPGVFFKMVGKVKGTTSFYAFHNVAARGTIIQVINPATQQSVYVKVLGPIPGTKQYANSIIGIGSGAKAALGAREDKLWVELKYAGY
jgi:LysM repeat protein